LSTSGIAVNPTKIAAVANWEPLAKIKKLQAFLGFCNFYRRFISDFSRVAKFLYWLTAFFEWKLMDSANPRKRGVLRMEDGPATKCAGGLEMRGRQYLPGNAHTAWGR
jgi:hypothetical protein